MDRIKQAREIGQSFWLDYIRRDLVENGELDRLIKAGEIRGVTSNPTIFQQAIGGSELYNGAMRPLAHAGWTANQIYESLAIFDIRSAADLLLPLYEGTSGRDGYVSIEVNPRLADDGEATLEEARRLWSEVNRPNLMVKIPATRGGIPAIEESIYEGINVNVTLIFALDRYSEVMEAYIRGLERRLDERQPLDRVASVASFFVSRVDTAVDQELEAIVQEEGPYAPRAGALLGKAAIANAKLAYAQFKSVFEDARFVRLQENGARRQRPLWASTSTKNPAYSDVLYVDELIGPDSVNTLPPRTLDDFRDHGSAESRLEADLAVARAQLEAIEALGISMEVVTLSLEQRGVRSFAESFETLIQTIGERAASMRAELGPLQPLLADTLKKLDHNRVGSRYWRHDLSLWPKADAALRDWPGGFGEQLETAYQEVAAIAQQIAESKPKRIAWISPSGRSAIPVSDSMRTDGLRIETLDPVEIRKFSSATPIDSTVFIVHAATAREPIVSALIEGIWNRAQNKLGDRAGQRFFAIAPVGSELAEFASERGFTNLLSHGAAAAVLLRAELTDTSAADIVESSRAMRGRAGADREAARNPGLYLGALLGVAAEYGCRRVGLVADEPLTAIADWLANRVAERGIGGQLSVLTAPPARVEAETGLLIYLRLDGSQDVLVRTWLEAGDPVAIIETAPGLGRLGTETIRWEMAAAIAAHLRHIDPYPTRLGDRVGQRLTELVDKHQRKGKLDLPKPTRDFAEATVWGSGSFADMGESDSMKGLAMAVAGNLSPGVVLNIGVYRRRSRTLIKRIEKTRQTLSERKLVDCRFQFGGLPGMPESKDQHPKQLALLLEETAAKDEPIPGRQLSYGQLQHASAMAAFESLRRMRRDVLAISLKPETSVEQWLSTLESEIG